MSYHSARISDPRKDGEKLVLSRHCTCCNYVDASKRKKRKAHLDIAKQELSEIDRKEKL